MKSNKVQNKLVDLNNKKLSLIQKVQTKIPSFKIYYKFLSRDDLKKLLGYHSKEKSMSAIEECLFIMNAQNIVQR